MSLKILHIYQKFNFEPTGGIEQAIKQYSFSLYNFYKCKNTLLYLDSVSKTVKKKYLTAVSTKKITNIQSCSIPGIYFFKKFIELQKKHDVILFHYPYPIQDLILIFGLINKPYFIYYHSDIIRQKKLLFFYKPFRFFFFKFAKKIITSSKNYLNSSIFLHKYRNKVIPISLILNKELVSVKKFKIPFKYFLFIGQFRHYKNIENIIRTFKYLSKHKLIIIGANRNQLSNYELSSNISVIDKVNDYEKYNYIQQCEALLLPSSNRAEAFGYALLEGLFFKKPLISSNIKSGSSKINTHLKTGYVINKYPTDKEIIKAVNFLVKNKKLFKKTKNYSNQIKLFDPYLLTTELYNCLKKQ